MRNLTLNNLKTELKEVNKKRLTNKENYIKGDIDKLAYDIMDIYYFDVLNNWKKYYNLI